MKSKDQIAPEGKMRSPMKPLLGPLSLYAGYLSLKSSLGIITSDKGGHFAYRNIWLEPWQGYFASVFAIMFIIYGLYEICDLLKIKKKANHKVKSDD